MQVINHYPNVKIAFKSDSTLLKNIKIIHISLMIAFFFNPGMQVNSSKKVENQR